MRVLVLKFITDQTKKVSLRINDVKEGLDELAVSVLMDTILEKNIFVSSSGILKSKDSAEIVVTTAEELNI
ncbi:MAG: DUF2922 domain-containing protein [Clostridium sp.]|nr:DUF2922 domain-containing protein [Clostridium sp.]